MITLRYIDAAIVAVAIGLIILAMVLEIRQERKTIERLKKSFHNREFDYIFARSTLMRAPVRYELTCRWPEYIVEAKYGKGPNAAEAVVRKFRITEDDPDYALRCAEELLDKLNEKI